MKRTLLVVGLLTVCSLLSGAEIPSPEEVFGHRVGADRKLIPYPEVLAYLESTAEASDRVAIEHAGESTLGNPMKVVVLTSPANHAELPRLREIARRLARPGDLTAEAARDLVEEGRVIALVSLTIHSTEVGSTQMVAEFVHDFATTKDPDKLAWMDEVVLLIMPSINPDGQLMVVDWYNKWLGTEYEGGQMPWLYQTYVGHDNNRDFYALTQKESQVVNHVLYHRWFPQVFLDEHQMGSTGPRMFVPPQADPLNPEVHSLVFRQADVIGTNMSLRLEEAGKTGVGHNMIFDSYWPGATRNTAWWKNVTGLLTEVASARIATPIFIDPGELRGGSKGLPEYGRRSNFPSPWQGGWWRLRDIVEYELVATWAYLEACADHRRTILDNLFRMAQESIERGRNEPPSAFVVPPDQHDPVASAKLIELLLRHGVEVFEATQEIEIGYAVFPAGTVVIPAAQPYRPFLLTMLRPQRYPEVRADVGGSILPPYDVTSWSLPVSMGVEVTEASALIDGPLRPIDAPRQPTVELAEDASGYLVPAAADTVYTAVNRLLADGHPVFRLVSDGTAVGRGDVYIPARRGTAPMLKSLSAELRFPVTSHELAPASELLEIRPARVGLFKPWVASMDEGWTRFVLERYGFPMVTLSNRDVRSGEFTGTTDVLLFPDISPSIITDGKPAPGSWRARYWSPLPPQYAGGIDTGSGNGDETAAGSERIKEWVENGATAVALDSSTAYLIELFDLPVTDDLADVPQERFNCPGSSLRVLVNRDSPLTWGMRSEEVVYFADSPAFRTRVPDARFERTVLARYPSDDEDILVSGFLEGGERLERRAAAVEFEVGEGRVILIGFRAQHRAQPLRTFKLLFNTLYDLERVEPGVSRATPAP